MNPDRYVVARRPDADVVPTGEPGDTGECWEVWDTTTDLMIDGAEFYTQDDARDARDRLEAEHAATASRRVAHAR